MNLVNCKRFAKIFLSKIFFLKVSIVVASLLAKSCFKSEQDIAILKVNSNFYRPDNS